MKQDYEETCKRCGRALDISKFTKYGKRFDTVCKSCRRDSYNTKNKEHTCQHIDDTLPVSGDHDLDDMFND